MAARQLGQDDKARQHEVLARQQDSNSKESLVSQGLALPYDERGIELMTKAIDRDPFDPVLHFYRGRIAYNLTVRRTAKRHYDLAVSDLEKALRGRPQDARISGILGLCLVQFCDFFADSPKAAYGRAKELLDEWLAREPNNTAAPAILADWHTRNSPLKAVIETCQKGEQLDPMSPEFPLFLGWGYRLHGQFQKAIDCFTRGIEMQPEPYKHVYPMGRVDLYAVRAQAFVLLGDKQAARRDLGIGTRWNSKERWTFYDWNEMVACYLLLTDFHEAVRRCAAWSQVAPECGRAYELQGMAYLEMSELEKAIACFRKAVEVDPRTQLYNLACFYSLASAAAKADPKKAEEHAAQAVALLRKAHTAAGWDNIAHARKDHDLDAIRNREDFRRLLQELEEKGKK